MCRSPTKFTPASSSLSVISGIVERNQLGGLEPRLTVSVMDAGGELQQFEVVLDTGFTGWLMLPEVEIARLGLTNRGERQGILASGNAEDFAYYQTSVLWHGRLRTIEVFQSIDQPLLGMELLEGSRVAVDAWDGGGVIIQEA